MSYITQVQTTTKDDKATTTTVTAPVAVMTGVNKDINILLSPALIEKLQELSAGNSCSQKRDSNCYADTMENIKNSDDPLVKQYRDYTQDMQFASDETKDKYKDLVNETDEQLQKRGVVLAGVAIYEILEVGWSALTFLAGVVGIWESKKLMDSYAIGNVPLNFPKISAPKKGGDDSDDGDDDSCPKDAPTGKDAPICDDCNGKDEKCTTV